MRIIVNPAAAGGRLGREWPRLRKKLADCGLEADTVFTEAPGHATDLAFEAADGGVERIIAAGGDGTICEAVEGLYRAGRGELAILPLGTGNDAARTLGVPIDLEAAARTALDGRTRPVDLIQVGDRVVLNAIGVGMTGDINDRAMKIKFVRGITMYLLATLSALFRYRQRPVRMVTEHGEIEAEMLILAVHGGPTTGGGFALTPNAVIDDGLLDACLAEECGPVGRLARLVAAMRGTLGSKAGSHEIQAKTLELFFERPLPAHLDGNSIVLEPPVVRFEVLPGALQVVAPE
jgi:YegS/Rv2252/BmrU family lipid kinase